MGPNCPGQDQGCDPECQGQIQDPWGQGHKNLASRPKRGLEDSISGNISVHNNECAHSYNGDNTFPIRVNGDHASYHGLLRPAYILRAA